MAKYAVWSVLMKLAKAVGEARLNGTPEELRKAEEELLYYENIVRESDGMILDPIDTSRPEFKSLTLPR